MEAEEASTRMEEDNSERRALDRKISVMRERFMMLQQAEKEIDDGDVAEDASVANQSTPKENLAAMRWNKIRKVVRSNGSTKSLQSRPTTQDLDGSDSTKLAAVSSSKKQKGLELEDIMLQDNWRDSALLQPFQLDEALLPSLQLPETADMTDVAFVSASEPLKLEVSRIPEEVVARRKDAVEQQALLEHRRALDNIKNSQVDVIWREHLARKRVLAMESSVKAKQLKEREKIVKLAMEKEQALSRDFRRAREELEAGIRRQQAAVKEDFGSLLIHEESLARRFQVYYNMFPQPMEFRIHLLRAVKNKLPKGAYVMMLTQYDRLGGYPLTWSTLGANGIGNLRPGITKIVKHQGRYFDRILRFEDSCFALCPPRPLLKPGFIFVLELFQLANFRNPEDRIVAWTALPMSYESMSLIEGKFKLPMLRGEHSSHTQHFRVMEQNIAHDLDHWLCNVYFEVRQVPLRELGATNEMLKAAKFDLDYFNKIIVPDSKVDAAHGVGQKAPSDLNASLQRSVLAPGHVLLQPRTAPVDQLPALGADKGIFRRKVTLPAQSAASHEDSAAAARSPIFRAGDIETGMNDSTHSAFNNHKDDDLLPASRPRGWTSWLASWLGTSAPVAPLPSRRPSDNVLQKEESFLEHRKDLVRRWKENVRNKVPHVISPDEAPPTSSGQVRERGYNLQDEIFLHQQQRGKLAGVESIDSHESRQWSTAGLEGKIVRKWHADGSRFDSDAIDDGHGSPFQSPSPKPQAKGSGSVFFPEKVAEDEDYQWEELRDIREMHEYNMAVASDPTRRKHVMPGAIARSKLRYLSLELFGDLVPFLFGTFEFYSTLFLYMFALWMRIYVHFLAQYLFLLAANTPVYGFRLRVLMITFKYMSAAISTSTEVGIVAIGPIANIAVFVCLVVFGHLFYQYSGFLPDAFSKFFAYYGVAVVLDPLLVAVVDLVYHNYDCSSTSSVCAEDYTSADCDCFNGDFVKLWYRMDRVEGSGLTGLVIVTMLYLACGVLTLLIMYEYLLNVHRDGRILDIWRRVNAPAEEFFIPDDFEVSAVELQDIIMRAKNWKGPQKARRRVYIQEGRETDPFQKGFQKTYKRYIIYESSLDGKTTSVHRQFLLDNDGKIVEIFADFKKKDEQQRAFNLRGALAKTRGGGATGNGDTSPEAGRGEDSPDSDREEGEGEDGGEGVNGNDEEDEEEDNYDIQDDGDEEGVAGERAGNANPPSRETRALGGNQRSV